MSEVSAKLVAEGVGLPPVWFDGRHHQTINGTMGVLLIWLARNQVGLTDPQTAFGLAMKLDEWEEAGGVDRGTGMAWSVEIAEAFRFEDFDGASALLSMIARIEHIGRDHAIRSALGWTVEPGTLAALERSPTDLVTGLIPPDRWVFMRANKVHVFSAYPDSGFATTQIPALAGVTDPAEALRVIYEAVCS
ncbi:hypothetical protein LCGC14_0436910 [marine sediment metagenome]|uniref:Uncharacterized protein n=1 Tax=marine sediment metagenome TaxID=412755 RepID=A0A0F9T4V1_9ZZZZ